MYGVSINVQGVVRNTLFSGIFEGETMQEAIKRLRALADNFETRGQTREMYSLGRASAELHALLDEIEKEDEGEDERATIPSKFE